MWLKSIFCPHDWRSSSYALTDLRRGRYSGVAVIKTCQKCGKQRIRASIDAGSYFVTPDATNQT